MLAAGALCPALLSGCDAWNVNEAKQAVDYMLDMSGSWESPYDEDQLIQSDEDGRFYYYQDGQVVSATGVDVSDHQGEIDWASVAADGITFANLRIGYRGYTEGGIFADEQFEANYQGCVDNGIRVGVYFFSEAITTDEAVEEAQTVLDTLGDREIQLPIMFDMETLSGTEETPRANGLSTEDRTAIAKAFCQAVEAAGYDAIIYGNSRDLSRVNIEELADYPIWFAQYETDFPTGHYNFEYWQYTDSGSVAGISTSVDMDLLFIDK